MNKQITNLPDEIRVLLDKYYSGISTLDEERELKRFFNTNNSFPEGEIFGLSMVENPLTIDNEQIWRSIRETEIKKQFLVKRIILVSSVAASLIIILTLGFFITKNSYKTEQSYFTDTYSDPKAACDIAQKYLSMISSRLTYAYTEIKPIKNVVLPFEALNSISSLEKGYNNLNKFEAISDYSNELKYITIFNEYIKINN